MLLGGSELIQRTTTKKAISSNPKCKVEVDVMILPHPLSSITPPHLVDLPTFPSSLELLRSPPCALSPPLPSVTTDVFLFFSFSRF
jgi:hypothetical protein